MNYHRLARRFRFHSLEILDDRIVPSGSGTTAANEALVALKGGQAIGAIYQEFVNYETAGGQGAFQPAQAGQIYFAGTNGTSVGVNRGLKAGDFKMLVGQLQSIGFVMTASSPPNDLVEGFLPISELPLVASDGLITTISPVYKPDLH